MRVEDATPAVDTNNHQGGAQERVPAAQHVDLAAQGVKAVPLAGKEQRLELGLRPCNER